MTRDPLILQVLRAPELTGALSLLQWDLLIRQARSANLLPRLESILARRDLLHVVPAQPGLHLEWARLTSMRHAQAVHTEVSRIREALPRLDLILLKGAAYTMAGLPAAAGRIFSDIDILIPKSALIDVESALMAHGWMATHHDSYDQRYYREWMHELPPLQHFIRQSVIDVHHAILPQTMKVLPDPARLRAAAVEIKDYSQVKVLSPVDMVLHSGAHLFYESEYHNGLRDLGDLDALLRDFSETAGFWIDLAARASELGLTRSLFYALRYTRLLLDTPIPDAAITAAAVGSPAPIVLWLMDAMYLRALLPDHPSCADRGTRLARYSLYLRATWLRMPPFQLARHLFHKAVLNRKES